MDFQIELSRALGLEKPIYLGQNSAGFLALIWPWTTRMISGR